MKKIRYLLEAALLKSLLFLFSLMSPATASNCGGFIGRTIGPRLAASRKARRNLERAMPGLSEDDRFRIIKEMWDNLGRVVAEYPHLEKICRDRVIVTNKELPQNIIDLKQGGIFITGHLSNWETNIATLLLQFQTPLHLTYRAANNPYTDRLIERARTLHGRIKAFPKARSGGREVIKALSNKEFVGILIDQKYNEGISVPFFDIPAMTNPAFVTLCQKFRCPLIPIKNRRTGPAQFEITVYDPLKLFDESGAALPVEQVILSAHKLLEGWIRENPGQWLWLHRRWGKQA